MGVGLRFMIVGPLRGNTNQAFQKFCDGRRGIGRQRQVGPLPLSIYIPEKGRDWALMRPLLDTELHMGNNKYLKDM